MNRRILFLILLGVLVSPSIALAQLRSYGNLTLADIVPKIEALAWIVFTVIVVICFVVAGVMLLTAQGDAEKLKAAKSAFYWGVAGVVVGILAYSIITIMTNFIT